MPPRTRSQSRALAQLTRHASGLDSGEAAHSTTAEPQVTLPADVLYLIVAECDRDWHTLMELRLTCKLLATEAAKYLFKNFHVTFYDKDMRRLVRMAEWPILAKSVKSLTIQDCPLIPKLSFYRFRKYIELKDESVRANTRYVKGLYSLYKEDEQARSAHERVCFMEDTDEYGPLYPQLEEAICNLPNLREIEILGPHGHDRPMWRGSCFDPKIEHEFDLRVNEAVAAAATAFLLRSIGLRNSSNSSLTCLTLDFPVTWWGPRDVQKAWESMAQYQIFDDDSDNESTNSDHETSNRATWVQEQITLTRGAFTHLKTLHLGIKIGQAALGNHSKALGDWFASAPRLQCLDLCTMCDEDDYFYDTLKGIVEHCQLPALQDLRLQVQDTSINSLITLLSRVSDTLRSLRLYWCMITVGTGDGDTWPNFYERMRDIPFKQLCHLDFTRCADFDEDIPDKSHDEDMILAVKEYVDGTRDSAPTEIVVHASLGPPEMRKAYSSDLYRYLLKETSVMPPLYLYYIEDEDSSVEGL